MPWVARALRHGIATTRYPRRHDDFGPGFRATVSVRPDAATTAAHDLGAVASACPTGAIIVDDSHVRVDRGRCVACGRCVEMAPHAFAFEPRSEVATLRRELLVVPHDVDDAALDATRAELARRVRALRRSLHVRHLDSGSDGSEEWEIAALVNPIYDVQRLGIFFTASPRHADMLLVTGAGSLGMVASLGITRTSMPAPTVVVAVGTDAISGGVYADSYATRAGVTDDVPVDVFVPGSPPSPFAILHGILLGMGRIATRGRA